jgi:hypothetical protein
MDAHRNLYVYYNGQIKYANGPIGPLIIIHTIV